MSTPLNRGFTLIELVITVSLLTITLGGSMAAYFRYQQRQTVLDAGRTIEQLYIDAKTQAQVHAVPQGCGSDQLRGYQASVVAGGTQLTIAAQCQGGLGTYLIQTKQETLPNSVQFASSLTTTFLSLYGGAEGAGQVIVRDSLYQYAFTIDPSGTLNSGEVVPLP